MRYKFISVLVVLMLFPACHDTRRIPVVSSGSDIPLIPYKTAGMGYLNMETLEVAIPAQFYSASPFVGDFAVVSRAEFGKVSIINRQNVTIIRNVNRASLYASEDGSTVFAVTQVDHGLRRSSYATGGWFPAIHYRPRETTVSLYNLNTGRRLLRGRPDYDFRDNYNIRFVSNYVIFWGTVYEIKNDGNLEKRDITPEELMQKVIAERNLVRMENDFPFPSLLRVENPHQALRGSDKPVCPIRPINMNTTYPLRKVSFAVRCRTYSK